MHLHYIYFIESHNFRFTGRYFHWKKIHTVHDSGGSKNVILAERSDFLSKLQCIKCIILESNAKETSHKNLSFGP